MRNFVVPGWLVAGLFASAAWADPFAYVPLSGEKAVAVVDLAINKKIARIPAGDGPTGIAISPNTNRAYVTNVNDGTVTVIDTSSNTQVGSLNVGGTPVGVAVSPLGGQYAIANLGQSSSNPGNTITIANLIPGGKQGPVVVGTAPVALAYNPAGTRIYVANLLSATVSVIDVATLTNIQTIGVPPNPTGLVINPAGTMLYLQHEANGLGGNNEISVVDLSKGATTFTIPLNSAPEWLAMNPAGTRLAVAKGTYRTVAIIDTGSNAELYEIQMNGAPAGVQYSADGKTLYVVNGASSELVAFDTTTNQQIGQGVTVGSAPVAFGTFITAPGSGIPTPDVLSGLWWNPNESGWGISFTQRHGNIFAAWFTYDANGNQFWYTAPNCKMPSATAMSCTGTVYQVTGPIIFGTTYNPALRNTTSVGTISIAFSDNNNASMTYTVNGVSRTVAIAREVFDTSVIIAPVDFTDMWWNPAEPGYGLSITQQHVSTMMAWYLYDTSGQPIWYVVPNGVLDPDGAGVSGLAYKTTGPPFGTTFDPTLVTTAAAGLISVRFVDATHGTLIFVNDTYVVTKPVTRMLF